MGTWKEIITRSLIVLMAALLIVVGFQMLASDQIADGASSSAAGEVLVEENMEGGEEQMQGDTPAYMGYVMSFVKEIMFMGIPFAITLGVLALIRKFGARRRLQQRPSGAAT